MEELDGLSSPWIFTVDEDYRGMNEKAFEPQVISIGPIHHGKEHLEMIEEHKGRYLRRYLDRQRSNDSVAVLDGMSKAVASMEGSIRNFYADAIDVMMISSHNLTTMMVLDGCFILETLLRSASRTRPDPDDPINNMPWVTRSVRRDLLLLENQIPWFVLETLFDIVSTEEEEEDEHNNSRPSLGELVFRFFNYPLPSSEMHNTGKPKHILDLLRSLLISRPFPQSQLEIGIGGRPFPQSQLETPGENDSIFSSARKLHGAGIKFRARKSSSLVDISFGNKVLEIPSIVLDDFFGMFLLNCLALEQRCQEEPPHVTAYAALMSFLIRSPGDVELLNHHEIIQNCIWSDEEVVQFFNNIYQRTCQRLPWVFRKSRLRKLIEDVNEFYGNSTRVPWWGTMPSVHSLLKRVRSINLSLYIYKSVLRYNEDDPDLSMCDSPTPAAAEGVVSLDDNDKKDDDDEEEGDIASRLVAAWSEDSGILQDMVNIWRPRRLRLGSRRQSRHDDLDARADAFINKKFQADSRALRLDSTVWGSVR